ncbi:MAG: hypothetical protein ACXAC6_15880 [Candidatus Hodarchaeales archaeon]|jgi:hypothetical protein
MEKRCTQIIYLVAMLVTITSTINPNAGQLEGLEWKVKVGDRMTYTITKVYEMENWDGDDDPSIFTYPSLNSEGEEVNITRKVGNKIKVEIKELNEHATVQQTINGIKLPSEDDSLYVLPTTTNKTYWEDKVTEFSNVTNHNMSLDGNEVTEAILTTFNIPFYGEVESLEIQIRNWKTGWLNYSYTRGGSLMNSTLSEFELRVSTLEEISVYEGIPLVLGLIILVAFSKKKQRK